MEVSNYLVSWFITYNQFMGLTTYLYRGYNPVTKFHGHPSIPICKGGTPSRFSLK